MIDTRDRILAAAGELFARQGSQNTSVREIAEALGLTKTAVLYHFRTKADILATLAQPLIDDTDAAVERVAREGGGGWGTVETLLEVYLRHRDVLSTIVANMPALPPEVFERWFTVMNRANEMVAGPSPDLGERVRAIQVVALLSDPVILLADVPTDELRHHILNGARRLLTDPPELPASSELPAEAEPPGNTSPSPRGRRPAAGGEGLSAGVGQSSAESEGSLAGGTEPPAGAGVPAARGRRPAAGRKQSSAESEGSLARGERPAVGRRWSVGGGGESPAGGERRVAGDEGAEGERRAAGGEGSFAGARASGAGEGALAGGGSVGGGGKVGGRPRSMSAEMIAEARRLRRNGDTTVSEIARILGVSRATLYRHL
ncbi:TetR family transcriptional regulator [Nonomuraea sp. NPDC059007]|uniref:TetR family transcriptional regulator n=1 Tax=Nonomuraea sp. NPDC059007 TaxID=3346692 RepID=UPI0036C6B620